MLKPPTSQYVRTDNKLWSVQHVLCMQHGIIQFHQMAVISRSSCDINSPEQGESAGARKPSALDACGHAKYDSSNHAYLCIDNIITIARPLLIIISYIIPPVLSHRWLCPFLESPRMHQNSFHSGPLSLSPFLLVGQL